MSYREQFSVADAAAAYDELQYRQGSYSEILWRIEQEQLRALVAGLRSTHRHIDYLDFAAGTGRVVEFVEPLVDSATAIEISPAMVERARDRVSAATVLCRDITDPQAPVEGSYDLITAFRFILNAEPALRVAGLEALVRRLRDNSSLLIVNNHGNLLSHKALLWPAHKVTGRVRPGQSGNCLSHRRIKELLEQAGLRVERVLGCGFLGDRVARRLPDTFVSSAERMIAGSPLARATVNQLYVCRRRQTLDRGERSAARAQ